MIDNAAGKIGAALSPDSRQRSIPPRTIGIPVLDGFSAAAHDESRGSFKNMKL
ncbi:hypothetical protein [Mesorhizobium sp.]|uniref:hypothetical protein n=1 Tax=Mesorhizobium sp. TaxID=1871066 RepID=UPI0025EE092A|nr:hypothetical protein [Mesorhizobium sp.]